MGDLGSAGERVGDGEREETERNRKDEDAPAATKCVSYGPLESRRAWGRALRAKAERHTRPRVDPDRSVSLSAVVGRVSRCVEPFPRK